MEKVRNDLRKLNMSASQIAREIGLLPQTVSAFLRGKPLRRDRFSQICKYLGYNQEDIEREFYADKSRSGEVIGYWTLIEPHQRKKGTHYKCRCICGIEREIALSLLLRGETRSCGCKRAANMTQEQRQGRESGQIVMAAVHSEGLSASYDNHAANKNSRSGVRGVCRSSNVKDKWRATISAAGKTYYLGLFDTIEEAAKARKDAEERLHRPLAEKVKKIKDEVIHEQRKYRDERATRKTR